MSRPNYLALPRFPNQHPYASTTISLPPSRLLFLPVTSSCHLTRYNGSHPGDYPSFTTTF